MSDENKGEMLRSFQDFIEATPRTPEGRARSEATRRSMRIEFAAASQRPMSDFAGWPAEDIERIKTRRAMLEKLRELFAKDPEFQKQKATWTKAEIKLHKEGFWYTP